MSAILKLEQDLVRTKYSRLPPEQYLIYLDKNLGNKDQSVLLKGKYFQIVKITGNNIKVICMQCRNKTTILSAGLDSTSNLLRHLRKLHSDILGEYESEKKSHKRPAKENASGSNAAPVKIAKQSTPGMFHISKQKPEPPICNDVLEQKIISLVANGLLPLSLVELHEFKDLLSYVNPAVQVPSRRTLARSIATTTNTMKEDIQAKLEVVDHVCVTCDIWSTNHRSFMGVTAHWINDDLSRGSAALACRRFRGTHSYDKIAGILDRINSEHGLSYRKVVSTVTDNASNMMKCFKEFGVLVQNRTDDIDEEAEEDDEEVIISNFPEEEEHEEDSVKLSSHIRCASHTLNLVATTDADKGLKSPGLKKIKHSSMGKCSALWNAAGKPKSAEKIEEITGIQFRYPDVTRWNSMYDSLSQINKHKNDVNVVLDELNLPILKDNELEFISEYLSVLKPIAAALNKLQTDKECFYGCLLPTLLVTQDALAKLEPIQPNGLRLRHCMPLLAAVISGFNARFGHFLSLSPEVTDAILASVSHPYFKLRWISLLQGPNFGNHEAIKSQVKDKLQMAVRNCNSDNSDNTLVNSNSSSEDNFFKTMDYAPNNKEDLEVLNYLQDTSKALHSLDKYPAIKKIFKRYNTTLPSSAPVERLFSFAGMVHSPKRSRLSDSNFEQLVLLKANVYSS